MENVNSHPLKVVTVEDEGMKANSHPYQVEVIAGDNIATEDWVDERIRGLWVEVDELPETGEEGVTYYLAKEGEVDTFDLYRWVNNGWIKIDTDVKLYSTTGENTDGPMTQKATTDATKFATGEAVSGLKIYSTADGNNTDGLVTRAGVRVTTNSVSSVAPYSSESDYDWWSPTKYRQHIPISQGGQNIPYTGRSLIGFPGTGVMAGEKVTTTAAFWAVKGVAFTGATSQADGVQGMVPKPLTTDVDKVLKGDGTWTINYKSLNGAGAPTTATAGDYVGQLYYDTTNDKMYYLSAITSGNPDTYTWEELGGGPAVVQTTGTSTTDVMSQDATTKMVFADGGTSRVRIGSTSAVGLYSIAIAQSAVAAPDTAIALGFMAAASGIGSIAIGRECSTTPGLRGAIALGSYSSATAVGEMNIGSSQTTHGYNGSNYRLLSGVYDPQSAHDAATKNYVDTAVASAGATVLTNTQFNNLWENA